MIYSHDTGEDRPLIEVCDGCDRDPAICGYKVDDCEDAAAARALERALEAWREGA